MNIIKIIGETTEYEKKIALETKKPKSWCKTISAFANGKGGKLIFGVDDNEYSGSLIILLQVAFKGIGFDIS